MELDGYGSNIGTPCVEHELHPRSRVRKAAMALLGGCVAIGCLAAAMSLSPIDAQADEQASEWAAQQAAVTADDPKWDNYRPKVTELDDGTRVQMSPYSGTPSGNSGAYAGWGFGNTFGMDWNLYNTYILNSDHRGCNSCHDLYDMLDYTGHTDVYRSWYPGTQDEYKTTSLCSICHSGAFSFNIIDFTHAHMQWDSFLAMGGNCNSCHYVTNDGDFLLWDDVKYDVLAGITDIDASEANISIEYDEDTTVPTEYLFFLHNSDDLGQLDYQYFTTQQVEHTADVRDTYKIAFDGACDNPCELSINELIDMFGSVTRLSVDVCADKGAGDGFIGQVEITGVPFKDVMEYLGVTGNALFAYGLDHYDTWAYGGPMSVDNYDEALLVYEMNGEPLNDDQGFPMTIWMNKGFFGASNVRYLYRIEFMDLPEEEVVEYDHRGYYSEDGEGFSYPDMGQLWAHQGQIFPVGEPVHLEGYAWAYDSPVTAIEFSLDHGASWVSAQVEDTEVAQWIYWRIDLDDLEPGAYLLEMRSRCVDAEGVEHIGPYPTPQYLFNVQ